jgi:cellulose synthase (UDP-forming)
MLGLILLIVALFVGAKKSNQCKKIFIFATIIYNLIYLVWRTIFTLPLSYGIISVIIGVIIGVILLLSEWMGFWQSLIFRIIFWKPFRGSEFPPQDFTVKPTVDVFIASYNENMIILKKTITGCLNLNYPKELINIYLCDDGRRQEAKKPLLLSILLCRTLYYLF